MRIGKIAPSYEKHKRYRACLGQSQLRNSDKIRAKKDKKESYVLAMDGREAKKINERRRKVQSCGNSNASSSFFSVTREKNVECCSFGSPEIGILNRCQSFLSPHRGALVTRVPLENFLRKLSTDFGIRARFSRIENCDTCNWDAWRVGNIGCCSLNCRKTRESERGKALELNRSFWCDVTRRERGNLASKSDSISPDKRR